MFSIPLPLSEISIVISLLCILHFISSVYDNSLKQAVDVLKLSLFSGQSCEIANYKNNLSYKVYLFTQVFSSLFDMVGKESLQADGSYEVLTIENLKNCEIYINNYYTENGNFSYDNEKCYFKIFVAQGVWHFWAFSLKWF